MESGRRKVLGVALSLVRRVGDRGRARCPGDGDEQCDGHFTYVVRQPAECGAQPVFCATGEFTGGIQGSFVNTARTLVPSAVEDVYAEELGRTSAATIGYRYDIADGVIYRMNGPMTLTLEDTAGVRRTVTVEPQPSSVAQDVQQRGVSDRANGPLADLGAPQIYYFNLNGFTTATEQDLLLAMAQAEALGTKGMVLDMRGYPAVNHYEVAGRLIPKLFRSANVEYLSFTGPDRSSLVHEQYRPRAGPAAVLRWPGGGPAQRGHQREHHGSEPPGRIRLLVHGHAGHESGRIAVPRHRDRPRPPHRCRRPAVARRPPSPRDAAPAFKSAVITSMPRSRSGSVPEMMWEYRNASPRRTIAYASVPSSRAGANAACRRSSAMSRCTKATTRPWIGSPVVIRRSARCGSFRRNV
jgi:hypothetical protein